MRSLTVLLAATVVASYAAKSEAVFVAGSETPAAVRVVAAGDIASCDTTGDSKTAELVRSLDADAVLTLGDNAYPAGTASDFAECYAPTWGEFKAKTYPAPGNHEYKTPRAAGYFGYFGDRARGRYYSFNLGSWHVVSLNSEIPHGRGSRQERWLRRDLYADRHTCELLYWHRPRWSGGSHGSDPGMQALWRAAYDHRVDLVLVAHDHNYQRFHKLDAWGRRNDRRGVRQLVVGTGGKSHYGVGRIANRAAARSGELGVLELTLRRGAYDLRFVPVNASGWTDALRDRRCS